ncbi:MAG: HAD-IIA family hydrolase [Solirubrobacteraceae bacterium]
MTLSPLLADYQNLILDLDGTVWVGGVATPGAPEAIAAIRAAGKAVVFLTNGNLSREEYVRTLWSIGCRAAVQEVITAGSAIQHDLAQREPGLRVYVIGGPPIFRHVIDAGHQIANHTDAAERADVVVVTAHPELSYSELVPATRALLAGAGLISGGHDATYPAEDGLMPGTGAIAAALEYATGRPAHSVGKPDAQIFAAARERLGEGRTLVIGDHLGSDIGGAHGAGLDAALVLTGVSSRSDTEAAGGQRPVAIGENLAALVLCEAGVR